MMKKMFLCLMVFALWSCESHNDEPEVPIDHVISLDTPPSEYKGYVYRYQDLDYDYLYSLGFDGRCEYAKVPEETLKSMTTEALAQCCMYWPVVGNHLAYPTFSLSIYDGILISFKHCDVLQELAKREQGAIALLKIYKYLNMIKPVNDDFDWYWHNKNIEDLNSILHKQHLEMLFATEYFTPKLSKDMLILLAEKAGELLIEQINDDMEISWYSAQYTYVLWQRVLLCYDKFTPILSRDERIIFTINIEEMGMEPMDTSFEHNDLISEKVRLMYETYNNEKKAIISK